MRKTMVAAFGPQRRRARQQSGYRPILMTVIIGVRRSIPVPYAYGYSYARARCGHYWAQPWIVSPCGGSRVVRHRHRHKSRSSISSAAPWVVRAAGDGITDWAVAPRNFCVRKLAAPSPWRMCLRG